MGRRHLRQRLDKRRNPVEHSGRIDQDQPVDPGSHRGVAEDQAGERTAHRMADQDCVAEVQRPDHVGD